MTDHLQSDETASHAPEVTETVTTPATTDAEAAPASQEASAVEASPAEGAADAPSAEAETAPAEPEVAVAKEATPEAVAPATPTAATPRPVPGAGRPNPGAVAPKAPAPRVADVVISLEDARKWGRVEGDGHVYVTVEGTEHHAGQYPGAGDDEALTYFARKFADIVAQVDLVEQRAGARASTTELSTTLEHLSTQLAENNVLGDIKAVQDRVAALKTRVSELEAAHRAEVEASKKAGLEAREKLVSEAEEIAGQDPANTMWKTSSARMNELFDAWKAEQKSGVRLSKSVEEGLWKRFRSARTVFDRHRRAYFSQLDSNNAAAKSVKEQLIAEAEKLSQLTDWGYVAGEYRRLMDAWKSAPRASRRDDDALWARFRAAQDVFFNARQAANDELEKEFAGNLVVKEQLLIEAQAIVPVSNLAAAKKALQSIRERWEEAGRVPRADMGRIDSALRKVEDAVREAEEENWRRSDPEAKARSNSMLEQLESTIAALRADLAKAEAAGDKRAIAKAQEALTAREQWLEVVRKSAQDLG